MIRLILLVILLLTSCTLPSPPIQYPDGTTIISRSQLNRAMLTVQYRLYPNGHYSGPPGDCKVRAVQLQAAIWRALLDCCGVTRPYTELQTVLGAVWMHRVVMVLTSDGPVVIDPNDGMEIVQ